jgi:hypothetical protein
MSSQIRLRIMDGTSVSNGNEYKAAQRRLLEIAGKVSLPMIILVPVEFTRAHNIDGILALVDSKFYSLILLPIREPLES